MAQRWLLVLPWVYKDFQQLEKALKAHSTCQAIVSSKHSTCTWKYMNSFIPHYSNKCHITISLSLSNSEASPCKDSGLSQDARHMCRGYGNKTMVRTLSDHKKKCPNKRGVLVSGMNLQWKVCLGHLKVSYRGILISRVYDRGVPLYQMSWKYRMSMKISSMCPLTVWFNQICM